MRNERFSKVCEVCGIVYLGVHNSKYCGAPDCKAEMKRRRENAAYSASRAGSGVAMLRGGAEREQRGIERVLLAAYAHGDKYRRGELWDRNCDLREKFEAMEVTK